MTEIEEGPVSEFHGLYENYGPGIVATFARLTRRDRTPSSRSSCPVIMRSTACWAVLRSRPEWRGGACERRMRRHRLRLEWMAPDVFMPSVALKEPRPGDARKVMFAIWAAVNLIKRVIVVDDDIDPWDCRTGRVGDARRGCGRPRSHRHSRRAHRPLGTAGASGRDHEARNRRHATERRSCRLDARRSRPPARCARHANCLAQPLRSTIDTIDRSSLTEAAVWHRSQSTE